MPDYHRRSCQVFLWYSYVYVVRNIEIQYHVVRLVNLNDQYSSLSEKVKNEDISPLAVHISSSALRGSDTSS